MNWRPRGYLSIRAKMILVMSGTLVSAIVVSAFLIRQQLYLAILSNKQTTADILTASLLHDIKFDMDVQEQQSIDPIIAKYMTYYRIIQQISYYDADGVVVADSDASQRGHVSHDALVRSALATATPTLTITRADWDNVGIRSVAPVLRGSKIVGAVAIDISINDIRTTLSAIDRRIATILVVAVLGSSAILFILLRTVVLARLTGLARVTQEISGGNYEIRVHDERKDELGDLAEAFNRMTTDLRSSKRELDAYNRQLEASVRDATSQLQKAYEDLKNAQGQIIQNEKMASLGVLIAGVAHEINTPVAAILNVSRGLESTVTGLPRSLRAYKEDEAVPVDRFILGLESVLRRACGSNGSSSYKSARMIEALLRERGVNDPIGASRTLARLNHTDLEEVRALGDCLSSPAFLAFAESLGTMAQAAKISETSSQRIMEIVRALKFYAYSDNSKVALIDVNESIRTALVLLRNQLKSSVRMHVELDTALPSVHCNTEIHQVWTNLIKNACDATEDMGEGYAGEIRVRTAVRGEHVVVTVEDNGCGIAKAHLDKVCDPFFTTKDVGRGTGLGLCLVSGIVKKHRGEIRIESERGRTMFEIVLPIAWGGEGKELAAAGAPAAAPESAHGGDHVR